MRTATAIYRAPAGDNKVAEMGGVTFFDGQSVDLNTDDHEHMISKLQNNPHFEVKVSEHDVVTDNSQAKRGPGRPPKTQDLKAGIENARDHDFEQDRRSGLAKTVQTDDKNKN